MVGLQFFIKKLVKQKINENSKSDDSQIISIVDLNKSETDPKIKNKLTAEGRISNPFSLKEKVNSFEKPIIIFVQSE